MRKTAWKVNRMRVVVGITLIMGLMLSGPSACKAVDAGYCASGDLVCDPLAWLFQQQSACSVLDSRNVTNYFDSSLVFGASYTALDADKAGNVFLVTNSAGNAKNYVRVKPDGGYNTLSAVTTAQGTDAMHDILPDVDRLHYLGKQVGSNTAWIMNTIQGAGANEQNTGLSNTLQRITLWNGTIAHGIGTNTIYRYNVANYSTGPGSITPVLGAAYGVVGIGNRLYYSTGSFGPNNEINYYDGATHQTLAGMNVSGSADGTGTAASFNTPMGLASGPDGYIVVADSGNNMIRAVSPQGTVTTLAGNSLAGTTNGYGSTAQFNSPTDVGVDGNCNIFVRETGNWVRKLSK